MKDYCNQIEYGREDKRFFVRSLHYQEYIIYADSLREAFNNYIDEYN